MAVLLDLDDQPALLAEARELTLSDGFLDDAMAIAARDEAGRLLAIMVLQAVQGEDADVHFGVAAPLRRDVIPMMMDLAFRHTGIERLWTTIGADNAPMLLVAIKVGWRVVGFQGGSETEAGDVVVMRLDRSCASWLPPAERADTEQA